MQYEYDSEVKPVLQSKGFDLSSVTMSLVDTGKGVEGWSFYHAVIHCSRPSDAVEIEFTYLVYGKAYAEKVVNKQRGMQYRSITSWQYGFQLKTISESFSDLGSKIDAALIGALKL